MINVAKMMVSVFERTKNIVGKVKNVDYQNFDSFSHNVCVRPHQQAHQNSRFWGSFKGLIGLWK